MPLYLNEMTSDREKNNLGLAELNGESVDVDGANTLVFRSVEDSGEEMKRMNDELNEEFLDGTPIDSNEEVRPNVIDDLSIENLNVTIHTGPIIDESTNSSVDSTVTSQFEQLGEVTLNADSAENNEHALDYDDESEIIDRELAASTEMTVVADTQMPAKNRDPHPVEADQSNIPATSVSSHDLFSSQSSSVIQQSETPSAEITDENGAILIISPSTTSMSTVSVSSHASSTVVSSS